jgi:cytoskeleton protein RodZ
MKTARGPVEIGEMRCTLCGANLDPFHLDIGLEQTLVCSFCGTPEPSSKPAPNDVTANGIPLDFGRSSLALRGARQRRGESLDDVADATGIRETYLADLESGNATFEPYPGHVYGRFFLREYAAHLELDPKPLVDAFDAAHEEDPLRFDHVPPIPPSGRRSTGRLLIAVAVSVVIAAGVMTQRERGWGEVLSAYGLHTASVGAGGSNLKDTLAEGAKRQREATPLRGSGSPRQTDRISARATIEAPSWVEVVSDGTIVHRAIAPAGKVLAFRADRVLLITFGNAGGVDLIVNGRPHPTGDPGEVVHLRFEAGTNDRA